MQKASNISLLLDSYRRKVQSEYDDHHPSTSTSFQFDIELEVDGDGERANFTKIVRTLGNRMASVLEHLPITCRFDIDKFTIGVNKRNYFYITLYTTTVFNPLKPYQ